METNKYDVVIVGAGLSGIAAAYHLQHSCPNKKITVLEGRSNMGGTWDLFKYPGFRSDSDMQTLGFSFYPWKNPKAIADGASILEYIKETASHFGIDKKIQYNHAVSEASWSDEDKFWTLKITPNENVKHATIQCNYLLMCSGYYDYKAGYAPAFPNSEDFKGIFVHPQKWDTTLSYENKNVVVIGSGATAITIVPEMAKTAKLVTMLQRSPTYIISLPSVDGISEFLKKIMPGNLAYDITKWKNVLVGLAFYNACKKWPVFMKGAIIKNVKKLLGNSADLKHFIPTYNPWDQRVCIVPDSDFFRAIKKKKVEVVTDNIEKFTPRGILLKSGKEIEADIIVSATGLVMQLLGGMNVKMNGKTVDIGKTNCYRGVMISDIPNFAITIGYTNASWTLKCDLSCHYVTRVINYMDQHNFKVCTPRFDANKYHQEPFLDFNSGYVLRAQGKLPQQGSKAPWKVYQNYLRDTISIKYGAINDKVLEYK